MKKYIITSGVAFLAFVSVVVAQNFTFSNDLSVGARGSDVSALQSWLINNGFDIPAISLGGVARGYFGAQTKLAVMKYQLANGIPNTGYVGRLTRAKLNEHKQVNPSAPVINSIEAPTILMLNQTGTWTVKASDPQNTSLNYSVDWGDTAITAPVACPQGYNCALNGSASPAFVQNATFTHSYSYAGTYAVRFTVKNSAGLTTQSSATVQVGANNASPLNVISPNGGEIWTKGTSQMIKWISPIYFRATYADIKLVPYYQPCTGQVCPMVAMMYPYHVPYTIATNVNINQNSYNWNVGSIYNSASGKLPVCEADNAVNCISSSSSIIPDGQYLIQICEVGINGELGTNCDSSDKPFIINSNTANNRPPVIIGVDAPTTLAVNQTGTWTIHASDPENGKLSYSVMWDNVNDLFSPGAVGVNTQYYKQDTTFLHSYSMVGLHIVTLTVADSAGLTAETKTTVNVTNSTQPSITVVSPLSTFTSATWLGASEVNTVVPSTSICVIE